MRKRVAERIAREQAKRDRWEAEIRAKQEAEVIKEREKEEKRAAKGKVKTKAKQEAEAQEHEETGEQVSAGLYEGKVLLSVMSPVAFGRLRMLEDGLRQVPNLSVVLVGGSVDKGTTITVSARAPIPLMEILRELPHVEQVSKDGKRVRIRLRTE